MEKLLKELLEIDSLKNKKNLLAFSAGVDSTALLFLLRELNISVDLALVNYGVRKESKDERIHAKKLAEKFNIKIYIKKAPKFSSNFEKIARDFRYDFFKEIIEKESYDNLITAHHLGDKVEWFLMRFIRGAGAVELAGMETKTPLFFNKKGKKVFLIRPLLNVTKDELIVFLEQKNIKYFIDKTNSDLTIERNFIREKFSNPLLKNYKNGIKRTFEYLNGDREYLLQCFKLKFQQKYFVVFELKDLRCASRATDIYLKKNGVLMSGKEKKILLEKKNTLIGRKWVAEIRGSLLFISPFTQKVTLTKKAKEFYRKAKIPPKVRGYLFKEGIEVNFLNLEL